MLRTQILQLLKILFGLDLEYDRKGSCGKAGQVALYLDTITTKECKLRRQVLFSLVSAMTEAHKAFHLVGPGHSLMHWPRGSPRVVHGVLPAPRPSPPGSSGEPMKSELLFFFFSTL